MNMSRFIIYLVKTLKELDEIKISVIIIIYTGFITYR